MVDILNSYNVSSTADMIFHRNNYNYTLHHNESSWFEIENHIIFYFVTFLSFVLASVLAVVHHALSDVQIRDGSWDWEGTSIFLCKFVNIMQ